MLQKGIQVKNSLFQRTEYPQNLQVEVAMASPCALVQNLQPKEKTNSGDRKIVCGTPNARWTDALIKASLHILKYNLQPGTCIRRATESNQVKPSAFQETYNIFLINITRFFYTVNIHNIQVRPIQQIKNTFLRLIN